MLSYSCHSFSELTLDQLYAILKLRQEVFIVEQNCPYLDADDKDQVSFHILGQDENGVLQTYSRLVPEGVSYKGYSSIGRVITSIAVRKQRKGLKLMEESIIAIEKLWPEYPIKISAQEHLQRFYNKFNFEAEGKSYLEDNIPHIGMIRPLS